MGTISHKTGSAEFYYGLLLASEVPTHLHDGIVLYLTHGIRPGHFLTAVLANNLYGAVMYGDDQSLAGLVSLVRWLYNAAPATCWSSESNVEEWITSFHQKAKVS